MPEATSGPGGRIDARERALELLYEAEIKSQPVAAIIADLPLGPDPFAVELVTGVTTHIDQVDADLTRVSKGWVLDRMPVIDRTVLRLGAYELAWTPEIPTAVVLNEAVELAKRFSTEKSAKFVNGVLSRLASEYR